MPTKSADAMAAKVQIARDRGAERMRRSRDLRRKGLRCYTLQIRESEIDALVDRGLLSKDERSSRTAVIKAMHNFLDRAFGWRT
jgi:hypothetical protein